MRPLTDQHPDAQSWAMLALLAAIWGGSFFFVGIAVKELPALLIVFARVLMAALLLLPIHLYFLGKLPTDRKTWVACLGMSVMNNVLPFTLIAWGQHHVASGLASVINATTPMFAVLFLALTGMEKTIPRKILALVIGFVGVIVLQGAKFDDIGGQGQGILAITLASAFYGVSVVWSKQRLSGIPPMTAATCQLLGSTFIMAILVICFSEPSLYLAISKPTAAALVTLAALSTSFAYLIFFRIIKRAGPTFVSLVTMLVPVTAIALGYLFLGENLSANEITGALIIGLALLIIDGRVLQFFSRQAQAN